MKKLKDVDLEKVSGGYTAYKESAVEAHIGERVSEENLATGQKYVIYDFEDSRYSIAVLMGAWHESGFCGVDNIYYKLKYDDGSTSDKRWGNKLAFFKYI